MITKQELREYINDLRESLPLVGMGTNGEYAAGILTCLNLFEMEFCGEDGVKKDEF